MSIQVPEWEMNKYNECVYHGESISNNMAFSLQLAYFLPLQQYLLFTKKALLFLPSVSLLSACVVN